MFDFYTTLHIFESPHVIKIAKKSPILSRSSSRLIVRFIAIKSTNLAIFVDIFLDFRNKIAMYRDYFLTSKGDPFGPSH
jgi:hypothetical protein